MNKDCSIVRDLLPLYLEDMVSEDTAAYIKEHLEKCQDCAAELEDMQKPVQPVIVAQEPDIDIAPMKRLKKKLKMEKVQAVLCTAAFMLALMLTVISFLTTPEYFTYSPELVNVTENGNGDITISFSSEITNYNLQLIENPNSEQTVYHLEAWTSAWDRMFSMPGAQDVTVTPENGNELLVYFTQYINQSSSNGSVCIYGYDDPNSGWVALPGLTMGYWLLINIVLFVNLGIVWLCLRKNESKRRRVEKFLLIPVAYGLGHLCVLGFNLVSHSEWRDAQMIVLIGVLFYCAMMFVLRIFYNRKEKRDALKDSHK